MDVLTNPITMVDLHLTSIVLGIIMQQCLEVGVDIHLDCKLRS